MKIGFIWDGNYPWDIRVEKICTSLIEAGHEVHMVCRNTRREKREEFHEGIHLHRLPYVPLRLESLNRIINFPAFFNPVWIKRIKEVVRRNRIQAIIVRDITLSLPTIWIARGRNIPVFLDMAEPYPEMIRAMWEYESMKPTDLLVRNPRFADWVEQYTLHHVDHIFAMVEESSERMINMGVPKHKISIVSNTPDLKRMRQVNPSYPGSLSTIKRDFKIIYIGHLTGSRGLQTVIKGLPLVLGKNPRVRLVIVGNGKSEKDLRALVKEQQVGEAVIFEGWIDNKNLPQYVSSCEVGLIPHYSCGLWDHTIPNKLFDYMATGRPVLCSDVPPMSRIVNETGCGLVYRDISPEDFANKILELSYSSASLREMGAKGEKAVKTKYNWNFDFSELLKVLENKSAA
jgi:glycosyltransferase involved in cell wall biosynthesis